MTLSSFINLFIRLTFVLLALLALRDLWRFRNRVRLEIAAMLASLVIAVMAGRIPAPDPAVQRLLQYAVVLALIAHPYLLLRLVHLFRPVSLTVYRIAGLGLVLSWALVLLLSSAFPAPLTLILVAYFVCLEGYAAIALFRGARAIGGVSRWRLGLIAAGSAMLAGAIVTLPLRGRLPFPNELADFIFEIMALLAAITYYLGFAPPRWLRRAWQLSELHRFLRQSAGGSINQNMQEAMTNVAHAATRTVGAKATVVLLGEKTDKALAIAAADGISPGAGQITLLEDGAATRAWYLQQPDIARKPEDFGLAGASDIIAGTGARAMFAVPIATAIHTPAMLLAFLRYTPLFVEDDLAMLSLFADQSAITLDNIMLLAEQRALVEKLRQNEAHLEELVNERTAELVLANRQLTEEAAERRRVANALHQLNEQLEQRVQDRTRQLEEANRELESFAYSVSHDLRSPLRAIDGFSKVLLEDYGEHIAPQGHSYLARVRANAQRMGELIDALLKLSRMSRTEMQTEQVDLTALAYTIMDELQGRDAGRNVELVVESGLSGFGDARLLRIALWNLLENAWKFTGYREDATIEFGSTDDNGQAAYFVRDNGAGFEMAYADKLFGAFQRLHRADEFAGTGIGLATVQRIIHRHNGRVWVQAAPDQGATFYFTLAPNGADD